MSNENKVAYIAGPMTGIKDYNKPQFNFAEKSLKELGFTVLNPASMPLGLSQAQYMDICFAMIRSSTHIYMLYKWEESLGAKAEYAYAKKLGLEIMGHAIS